MNDERLNKTFAERLKWLLSPFLCAIATAWFMADAALGAGVDAPAGAARGDTTSWTAPTTAEVRAEAMHWLETRGADEASRQRAEQVWAAVSEQSPAADRFDALVRTFALGNPRAEQLVRFCEAPRRGTELPEITWLAEPETPRLVSANLRLLVGRWLVRESLFDETLDVLADVKPDDVVDPASLFFQRAVAHHSLLHKDEGLDAVDRLLKGRTQAPRRYVALAGLMRDDLEGLEEETLDHIARRMRDIERRLDLGRAGEKVRRIEDGVIESLDKMIEELEKQQQESGGGVADNLQPMNPAQDSMPMGGLGQGQVTRKKVGDKSGWGNLPPKQREEALQEIGRQFPSHYRDVIEQYFRRMAGEEPTKE
ncbi:MAG TPA: hypothetical protein DD670_03145 [Planctomycetaceae bacterium]|nr:hypothetical protein [Planctomycetaceae bacterium]